MSLQVGCIQSKSATWQPEERISSRQLKSPAGLDQRLKAAKS
ncbi:MAG: hypothetical protein ACOCSI_01990 [Desulfohalobiaceae bacterium]